MPINKTTTLPGPVLDREGLLFEVGVGTDEDDEGLDELLGTLVPDEVLEVFGTEPLEEPPGFGWHLPSTILPLQTVLEVDELEPRKCSTRYTAAMATITSITTAKR